MSAKKTRKADIPPLEWAVAGLGLVVVTGLLGFFGYRAVAPDRPPQIVITVDTVVPSTGGFAVELTARNQGTRTAAAVVIEGTLDSAGVELEAAQTTLDYLPGRSHANATLLFERNPRGRLTVRPRSHRRP